MYEIYVIDKTKKIEGVLFGIVSHEWIKYILPAPSRERKETVCEGKELYSIHNRIAGLLLCYAYNDDFLKDDEHRKLVVLYSDKLKMFGNGTSECTLQTLADCIGEIKRIDFMEVECNIDFLVGVYTERKSRIETLKNLLDDIEDFIKRNPDTDCLSVIIRRKGED